jgi:hypothetical protein
MSEQPSVNHEPVHADVSYDKSETSLKPAVVGGIAVIVLCLLAYGISLLTFDGLKASAARRDPGLSLLARDRPKLPQGIDQIPNPRLEVDEIKALKEQLERDEKRLIGYGWTDAKQGTVHIPIAKAMRLLADPEAAKAKGIRVESPKGGAQ